MKCIQPRVKCRGRRRCLSSIWSMWAGACHPRRPAPSPCSVICAVGFRVQCGSALMPCLHLFSTVRACAILINMQIQLKMPIYAWHNIPRKKESTNSNQEQNAATHAQWKPQKCVQLTNKVGQGPLLLVFFLAINSPSLVRWTDIVANPFWERPTSITNLWLYNNYIFFNWGISEISAWTAIRMVG